MSLLSIVIVLIGLGVLAAVHEVGHFLAARRLGIKVEELSIFVGPALFSWKRNGVNYNIRLIPFGAYVRFVGMDGEEPDVNDPDFYFNQPRWKRLLVSLAGPAMNLLLGVIIFVVLFSVYGFTSNNLSYITSDSQIAATQAKEGDTVLSLNGSNILTDVDFSYLLFRVDSKDSLNMSLRSQATGDIYDITLTPTITPKYRLGISVQGGDLVDGGWKIMEVDPKQNEGNPVLKKNDILLKVNGVSVTDPNYANVFDVNGGNNLTVTIIRDKVEQEINMKATIFDTTNDRGIYLKAGSGVADMLRKSVLYPISIFKVSILSLRDAITGRVPANEVIAGPVGIVSMVSGVVDAPKVDNSAKAQSLWTLAGFISVALAFTNLLPLPGLDGNALVLVIIEMIRGKKISLRTESIINVVGFVILISLVIFALFSDISRLWG